MNNTRLKLLWFVTLSLLLVQLTGVADMIVLRNGREYKGTLIRADKTAVTFLVDGQEKRYARSEVIHVRVQRHRQWSAYTTAAEIPDPVLKKCLALRVDPRRFPGAGTYTLLHSTEVVLKTADTWTTREREIVRILSEHGEKASVKSFSYRKDVEHLDIKHAVSIRADGTVIHLRDTAVQKESPYGNLPQYDRLERVRLAMPEGKPGVVLDSDIVKTRSSPLPLEHFYREFLLGGADPMAAIQVRIWVPNAVRVNWKVLNDQGNTVVFKEEKGDGGRWLEWRRENTPLLSGEPLMPPWADVIPRLVTAAGMIPDWTAPPKAYARYAGSALAEAAPDCPKQGVSPAELCEYVSRSVKNAHIDLAATGRFPGDLRKAWSLKIASNLDRAALLAAWLQQAGTSAQVVWVRPRQWGPLPVKTIALGAFVVPAVYVPDHTPRFLFPGDEMTRAEDMTQRFMGAEAWVPHVGILPVKPQPAKTLGTDRDVIVRLDDSGAARVEDTIHFRGLAGRQLRKWRNLTAEERQKAAEGRVASLISGARDVRYEILGEVTENAPMIGLRLRYAVPDFADHRQTLTACKMPWLDYNAWGVGRTNRQFPMQWGHPRRDVIRLTVQVPEGWRREAGPVELALPPDRQPATDTISLTARIKNKNALETTCEVVYERTRVTAPRDYYPSYKSLAEARAGIGTHYWVWSHAGGR